MSFVKKLTKKFYSDRHGRPSIDPEVFFRIGILGHIYGIKSDRRLCDEITVNLAYRWFVRLSMSDAMPDHSSLTRVRDRLGVACFAQVFEQIVEQCRDAGLVPGEQIITDATLVEADASARKLERRAEASETVAVADKKQPSKDAVSQTAVVKRERVINPTQVGTEASDASLVEARASARKLERRAEPTQTVVVADKKQPSKAAVSQTAVVKRERVSNRTHVSKVDGDASLVNRQGYPRKLYHKVHYCADATSRVITDCYVTTGACHETNVITQRVQYQQQRFGLPIVEVIADVGYSSGKNDRFFEEHKIRSYIPTAKCRRKSGKQVAHEGSFKYDRKQDIYTCQAGHALYSKHAVGATKYYHIKKAHCNSCQWQKSCYLGKRHTGLYRNEHKAAIERVRRRQGGKVFKRIMRERSWKIEGLFGEAKEQHGLRRAKI